METKVEWIHLSDLHINKRGVDNQRMREKLLSMLKNNGIKCKYIFLTGDIRYAPDKNFSVDEVILFLEKLCDTLGVEKKNVYIVPGNHDIERDCAERADSIERLMGSDGYYNPKEGVIEDVDISNIAKGKSEFEKILEKFYIDVPERVIKYKDSSRAHFNVVSDDFNIFHLDSTLTYSENINRDFIVGTEGFLKALSDICIEKPTILLSHYSFDFLSRGEQEQVLQLLIDHNIQLWFAGHEHNNICRKQRDYFFEFQCGNMMHENNSKSCIIYGEYNTSLKEGKIVSYLWNTPCDWIRDSHLSLQDDKSTYGFELTNYTISKTPIKRLLDSPENAKYIRDNKTRKHLPKNIEVCKNIDVELNNTVNNLFASADENIQQEVFDSYLYMDNNVAPFCSAKTSILVRGELRYYQIETEAFQISLIDAKGQFLYEGFEYNLNKYKDVDKRLLWFKNIKKYIQADSAFLKNNGGSDFNIAFKIKSSDLSWKQLTEDTILWIGMMEKLSKIENHFNIKFGLPSKATEDDYFAIEIISDSIDGKCGRTISTLKMEDPGLKKRVTLDEDVLIGSGGSLAPLHLFGYIFSPIAEYLMAGRYRWDRRNKEWTVGPINGLPLRIEFEINFEEDANRELILIKSIDEFHFEADIPYLKGNEAESFKRYVEATHDFLGVWQLYLSFQHKLSNLFEYDFVDQSGELIHDGKREKVISKITVNELTNNVVSTGSMLIMNINAMMGTVEPNKEYLLDTTLCGESDGFAFLTLMNQFSDLGNFPISAQKTGYCYYNLKTLEMISNNDENLMDKYSLIKEKFGEYAIVDYYYTIENYLYIVARQLRFFYNKIGKYLEEIEQEVLSIISANPDLVINTAELPNYVGYMDDDEKTIHVFKRDVNIMSEYVKCKNEADKFYCMTKSRMYINEVWPLNV